MRYSLMRALTCLSLTTFLHPAIAADATGLADATAPIGTIKPPPRSDSAARIVVTPGEPLKEIMRDKHGRHHPGQIKKDVTRDDTIPERGTADRSEEDSDDNSDTDSTSKSGRNP